MNTIDNMWKASAFRASDLVILKPMNSTTVMRTVDKNWKMKAFRLLLLMAIFGKRRMRGSIFLFYIFFTNLF